MKAKPLIFTKQIMQMLYNENQRAYSEWNKNNNDSIPVKKFYNIEQFTKETIKGFSEVSHSDTVLIDDEGKEIMRVKGNYKIVSK